MTTNASYGATKTSSRGSERQSGAARRLEAVVRPEADGNPTYEQIAERARAIWQSKGCPSGQDEQNWREAEAILRSERRDL